MSQKIQIQILNKIATCLTELPIVCGNSDYIAEFSFDESAFDYANSVKAEYEEYIQKRNKFIK